MCCAARTCDAGADDKDACITIGVQWWVIGVGGFMHYMTYYEYGLRWDKINQSINCYVQRYANIQ